MATSVNKVILVGNLGKDPDVRHFDNGGAVANFTMATTESYFNRETNERVDMPTDWHNIAVKRPGLVKIVEAYIHKGDKVYIEGKLRTRSYQSQEGVTKYITEVVVDDLVMMAKPNNTNTQGGFSQSNAGSTNTNTTDQPTKTTPAVEKDMEDDLPF